MRSKKFRMRGLAETRRFFALNEAIRNRDLNREGPWLTVARLFLFPVRGGGVTAKIASFTGLQPPCNRTRNRLAGARR